MSKTPSKRETLTAPDRPSLSGEKELESFPHLFREQFLGKELSSNLLVDLPERRIGMNRRHEGREFHLSMDKDHPIAEQIARPWECLVGRLMLHAQLSFLNLLMILGIKSENIKSPIEKKTLKEISCPQLPLAQTCFNVPTKNVKIKVPTTIPSPVPKK